MLVTDMVDKIVETLDDNKEAALIAMDLDKAYKIVNHTILLRKLRIVGFSEQATQLTNNYLTEWKQYVQINAIDSEILVIGNQSVIQGSTMSGLLFQIYTLDAMHIFHDTEHNAITDRKYKATSIKIYVDDLFPLIIAEHNENLTNKIKTQIKDINKYMDNNKLSVNIPKTKIMLLTKDIMPKTIWNHTQESHYETHLLLIY